MINSLYRVRVHGWICVITSVIALCFWIYFCCVYEMGDSDLVTLLKETTVTGTSASKIAEALAGKMREGNGSSGKEVKELVKDEFKETVTSVGGTGTTVEVKIGSSGTTEKGRATVTVNSQTITIQVMGDGNLDTEKAMKIAKKLASALTKVDSVKGSGDTPIPVTVSMVEKIDTINVWSPLLLFPVGSAVKDFLYPAILPFALLDNEKSGLINYLAPAFFMTGAILIVLFNDGIKKVSKFKDWSASTYATEGKYWHALWALNIPKYIAFLIIIWSIHGTFPSLRCIVQSRLRVLVLTMFIIIPRATLEVAGYVGVANYAIGRADLILGGLAPKLKKQSITVIPATDAGTLQSALNGVKTEMSQLINVMYGATVEVNSVTLAGSGAGKLKVKFTGGELNGNGTSRNNVHKDNSNNQDIQFDIKVTNKGNLPDDPGEYDGVAEAILAKLKKAAKAAKTQAANSVTAEQDFNAFTYIAYHDMLAMFCRFFYGKLSVEYNCTKVFIIKHRNI